MRHPGIRLNGYNEVSISNCIYPSIFIAKYFIKPMGLVKMTQHTSKKTKIRKKYQEKEEKINCEASVKVDPNDPDFILKV